MSLPSTTVAERLRAYGDAVAAIFDRGELPPPTFPGWEDKTFHQMIATFAAHQRKQLRKAEELHAKYEGALEVAERIGRGIATRDGAK